MNESSAVFNGNKPTHLKNTQSCFILWCNQKKYCKEELNTLATRTGIKVSEIPFYKTNFPSPDELLFWKIAMFIKERIATPLELVHFYSEYITTLTYLLDGEHINSILRVFEVADELALCQRLKRPKKFTTTQLQLLSTLMAKVKRKRDMLSRRDTLITHLNQIKALLVPLNGSSQELVQQIPKKLRQEVIDLLT